MLIILKKLPCQDFITALLHFGIAKVIDEEGIRQHVLNWAKIILESKNQQARVYQSVQEQAKWDHMAQIVAAAEDIVIGRYRFKSGNLVNFYNIDQVKEYYSVFLKQPIVIEYQEKPILRKMGSQGEVQNQIPQLLVMKKNLSSPTVSSNINNKDTNTNTNNKKTDTNEQAKKVQDEVYKIQLQHLEEMDVLGIDSIRQGYLNYTLDSLIQQVQ